MSVILKPGQARIVEDACNWYYNSSEQVFEFAGLAGTGKSVVLYEIVKRLHLRPKNIMPMAYTGQASIIMRLKGFPNARSIHSNLYKFEKIPNEYQDNPFRNINTMLNSEKYHFVFSPIITNTLFMIAYFCFFCNCFLEKIRKKSHFHHIFIHLFFRGSF